MNDNNKISVIISLHNSLVIDSVVNEVLRQDPYECIVIADNCSENTKHRLVDLDCHVIYSNKDIWISRSRNLGISVSKGETIAFLDGDCIPQEGWLDEIRTKIKEADIVYGKRISENLPKFDYREIKYRIRSGKNSENEVKLFTKENLNSMYLISGQNMAVRKDVFKHLLFNTIFDRIGGEDINFQWQAIEAGFSAIFDPDMVVKHVHPHSVFDFFRKAIRYGKSDLLLEKMHPSIKNNIWWKNYTPPFNKSISFKGLNNVLDEVVDYTGRLVGRTEYRIHKFKSRVLARNSKNLTKEESREDNWVPHKT